MREIADSIIAVAIVALVVTGVLTALVSTIRDAVLRRFIGSIWYAISAKSRDEERRNDRQDRLRGAVGVLSEGLTIDFRIRDAQIKINQALSELRSEGPPELKGDLERVVNYVSSAEQRSHVQLSPDEVSSLVAPIIDSLRSRGDI